MVLGNAGSAMEGRLDPALARQAQPAPGAVVDTFVTQDGFGFGFATLDATSYGWHLTEWSVDGAPLLVCDVDGTHLICPAR